MEKKDTLPDTSSVMALCGRVLFGGKSLASLVMEWIYPSLSIHGHRMTQLHLMVITSWFACRGQLHSLPKLRFSSVY